MNLGDKFKHIRYNNSLSQEQMAEILEINRNYLSRIETNKSLPTTEVLTRLAESFNISVDSLLDISSDNKKSDRNRTSRIRMIEKLSTNLSVKELDFIIDLFYNNSRLIIFYKNY